MFTCGDYVVHCHGGNLAEADEDQPQSDQCCRDSTANSQSDIRNFHVESRNDCFSVSQERTISFCGYTDNSRERPASDVGPVRRYCHLRRLLGAVLPEAIRRGYSHRYEARLHNQFCGQPVHLRLLESDVPE